MIPIKSILQQEFSLPKPILRNLIENVTAEHIKKLQQTCRYFYLKFNYNVIDGLWIEQRDTIYITNYNVSLSDKKIEFLQNNIYLNKRFIVSNVYENLGKLFQKIIKSDIYELNIWHRNGLQLSDFAILAKSENLKCVKIYSYIYYSDEKKVPVEDILSYIPNATKFINEKCIITSNTSQKLFTLKRNTKFKWVSLDWISELLDANLFNNFIKKNFDFDSDPNPLFELRGDHAKLQEIYELVKIWREKSNFELHDFLTII
uniref:F-box domain-containing protein n=1 Tax=Panagrolaimus sp. PS1159 TaxID=55785 RepID=A0AC35FJM2_9BILA